MDGFITCWDRMSFGNHIWTGLCMIDSFVNICGNIISKSVSRTALHRKSETDNTIILDSFLYYFMRNALCIFYIKISTGKVYHKLCLWYYAICKEKAIFSVCTEWPDDTNKYICTNILNSEINTNAKHLLPFSISSVVIKL